MRNDTQVVPYNKWGFYVAKSTTIAHCTLRIAHCTSRFDINRFRYKNAVSAKAETASKYAFTQLFAREKLF